MTNKIKKQVGASTKVQTGFSTNFHVNIIS